MVHSKMYDYYKLPSGESDDGETKIDALIRETKEEGKINYSKIAKQYNCDPRTVKKYFNERDANPTVRKPRVIVKVTDGFEELIERKILNDGAPANAIYDFNIKMAFVIAMIVNES